MNQLSYITPFLMIILSTGRRQLSTYLVTLLILIFAIMDIHYFVNPNKPDFPELKTFLTEENNNDVTNLIWEPSPNISYVLRYYGLNIKSLYYQNNNLPFSDRDGLINNGDYIESIEDINKIGIITNSEIGDNFSDSHTLQNTVKFKGVNYFVLTKND